MLCDSAYADTERRAVATIKAFTDDLLFLGQSQAFFTLVNKLAFEADSVKRGF